MFCAQNKKIIAKLLLRHLHAATSQKEFNVYFPSEIMWKLVSHENIQLTSTQCAQIKRFILYDCRKTGKLVFLIFPEFYRNSTYLKICL